jgi:hypothetical protein
VAVEGDTVVLGFEFDLHRARAEEESNKRDVEEVLSSLAGRPVMVRCVLAKRRGTSPRTRGSGTPPVSAPGDEFDEDPVVRAALDLGAQVVTRSE